MSIKKLKTTITVCYEYSVMTYEMFQPLLFNPNMSNQAGPNRPMFYWIYVECARVHYYIVVIAYLKVFG